MLIPTIVKLSFGDKFYDVGFLWTLVIPYAKVLFYLFPIIYSGFCSESESVLDSLGANRISESVLDSLDQNNNNERPVAAQPSH